MTSPQPAAADDLHRSFRDFVRASQQLEQSYAALQRRAAAIDIELATTNRALQQALGEKEAILGSLPVGVLTIPADGDAAIGANPEGHRLLELLRNAGIDPATLGDGECETDGFCVAVRRAQLPDGGTLLVVEDRSPLRHLTREVDRLDRLAGLSELALGIAHEIKNPLNGVMGFAALMDRTGQPEEIQRYAGKIRDGLEQVDEIVREMLAFAESPAESRCHEPLAGVVRRAAADAGVPMSCIELQGDVETAVENRALLRVLANLLRNSAEAATTPLRLRCVAAAGENRLVLRITDNGPGVPAELGRRIFEPFVSSKDRGHGLGLALAHRVMTYLGGALELSNPGEPGASFVVTLPHTVLAEADRG